MWRGPFSRPRGGASPPSVGLDLQRVADGAQHRLALLQLQVVDLPHDEDGALGRRRVFHPHSGDGVKVDRMGHVYVATADGVGIFNREGRRLGTIVVDQRPANLAWGEDGSTLYITATRSLYRVRLTVVGVLPNATGGR